MVALLESLDESFDINNTCESIRENIKTIAKDNKHGLMMSAQN
jgi:hypothetical protein